MSAPQTIYLRDYTPPAWLIDTVSLHVAIHDDHTLVDATLHIRRAPNTAAQPLSLDGEELALQHIAINDVSLKAHEYSLNTNGLTIHHPPQHFTLTTQVKIDPNNNTQLSGLYRSQDGYFTQCEAQGFRRITYYPDRPDVLAVFTCKVSAALNQYPVLLANGNPVEAGHTDDGRHWAIWHDPFPKPAYLFACVAANLDVIEAPYTTTSGRSIRCAVYVEPGKTAQCQHALEALQKAMRWDEEVYGLEMDLGHYMIVAVGDFNMGAMENKGLNIFNTKYVLAAPDTATDIDYQNIDRVVAHEYFHNWTGNRVTCRDWFQLSLKEGLTVFRDQNFGMDIHSRGVTRIQEVRNLRAAQFPEDAGPMAHPIRPASYAEINNFYTATVYEKGAEVIRMIHTLLGAQDFRRGMDLYFARHDGQAVCCEDFISAMQDASGHDLQQFLRWYTQAGTPRLKVTSEFDASTSRYRLNITQYYPETAYERNLAGEGHTQARGPYHLPFVVALFNSQGQALPLKLAGDSGESAYECVLELREKQHSFVFENISEEPTPSLLRNFSAPVTLEYAYSPAELTHLMAYDSDPLNRWDAGQRLATNILLAGIAELTRDESCTPEYWIPVSYLQAVDRLLGSAADPGSDPALIAEALTLPAETQLAEQLSQVDPDAIHLARVALRRHLALTLRNRFQALYDSLEREEAYRPDGAQVGRRALRNTCLSYLAEIHDAASNALVVRHFENAGNMTDTMAALQAIANLDIAERHTALASFYSRWQHEALVVDKWLQVQATSRLPATGQDVRNLLAHPAFDLRNPNKVYSLVRAFCAANPRHFHAISGEGYRLAADVILQLDAINPQVAARIARCFDRWKKFDPVRKSYARTQLERIQQRDGLSGDVAEVIAKALQ